MNKVIVPWQSQNDVWWNETCASIMDHFGLPGGRYITQVSTESMDFTFYDSRDALLCQIMISDKI